MATVKKSKDAEFKQMKKDTRALVKEAKKNPEVGMAFLTATGIYQEQGKASKSGNQK